MGHSQRREDNRLRAFVVSELVAREQSLEPWTPASDEPCPCDECNSPLWEHDYDHDNTPPLALPLGPLLMRL